MKTVKFSVIGNGFISKKHQYFIEAHANAQLVSVVDSNGTADFKDLDSFILEDAGKSDVICITTPNALHVPQALKLLEAGYHVVIEKPMALSSVEAQKVLDLAEKKQKQVFIVMQNRYSPAGQWLKKLADSGALGRLYFVQVNCYWNRDERYYKADSWHGKQALDGGTIYTQFSHFVDLLYWCFGELEHIQGRLFDFNHQDITEFEDSGEIQFDFKSGGPGQFNFSTSAYAGNLESSIVILSELGTIKIGGQYMDEILHLSLKDETIDLPEAFRESYGKYSGNAANHRFVIDNVVQTINGHKNPDTTAQEGLAVVHIIEEMYQKAKPS